MLVVTSENLKQVQRIHSLHDGFTTKTKEPPLAGQVSRADGTRSPVPDWGGSLFWILAARREQ
jgi:hypothetical protein